MANYGQVRTDKLAGTTGGAHIYSAIDEVNNVENGSIVTKGDLVAGEREIYEAGTPTDGDHVYLVASPELVYDQSRKLASAGNQFINAKGQPFRIYDLVRGDIFSVSDNLITAIAAKPVAKNLIVADGRKYEEVAAATDVSTYNFVAKILDVEVVGQTTYVGLEVIKNA